MNIKLCSSRWGELSLGSVSEDPANILILPNAEKKCATNSNGDYRFLFQELSGEVFKARFSLCLTKAKDTYSITSDPGLSLHFGYLLSHSLYHPHLGRLSFHQNSYNFIYCSHAASEFTMEPYEKFIVLDVFFQPDILEPYLEKQPLLDEFIISVGRKLPSRFRLANIVAPIEVLRWLDELIDYGTSAVDDKLYFDAIGYHLLDQCISSIHPGSGRRGIKLRQSEIDKFYFIGDLLKGNDKEFSLKQLATMIDLTPNRLDKGFRQIFGHSVLHHRKEEKMRLALRLIENKSLNLKEVSSILGYKEPQSFSRAFKNRFGYSPYRDKVKNAPES